MIHLARLTVMPIAKHYFNFKICLAWQDSAKYGRMDGRTTRVEKFFLLPIVTVGRPSGSKFLFSQYF